MPEAFVVFPVVEAADDDHEQNKTKYYKKLLHMPNHETHFWLGLLLFLSVLSFEEQIITLLRPLFLAGGVTFYSLNYIESFIKRAVMRFVFNVVFCTSAAVDLEASSDDLARVANVVSRAHHLLFVRGAGQEDVLPQAWYEKCFLVAASFGVPHERYWVVGLWLLVRGGTVEMNILACVLHLNNFGCFLHPDIHRVECDDLTHGAVEGARDTPTVVYGSRLGVGHDARVPVYSMPFLPGVNHGKGVRVVAGHGDGDAEAVRHIAGVTHHGKRLPLRQLQVSKRLLLLGYGVSGHHRRPVVAEEGDVGSVRPSRRRPQKQGLVATVNDREQ